MVDELIKSRYSQIIGMTKYQKPNYEVIDFEKFIHHHFGIDNFFLPEERISSIRKTLKDKYSNEKSCFRDFGNIEEIPFKSMKYYQPEVGISGPKYTLVDEPVSILLFGKDYILWDGYHRSLVNSFEGQLSARGYVLQLNE